MQAHLGCTLSGFSECYLNLLPMTLSFHTHCIACRRCWRRPARTTASGERWLSCPLPRSPPERRQLGRTLCRLCKLLKRDIHEHLQAGFSKQSDRDAGRVGDENDLRARNLKLLAQMRKRAEVM